VLLIDADLRRPMVHEIFGLDNQVGLTTLLFVDPDTNKSDRDIEGKPIPTLNQCLQTTSIPNLKVITSGFIPSNPSEILGSDLMKRWVDAFRNSANVDVVIIDTPPVLLFSDVSILAGLLNSAVIMVTDSQRTRRKMALQALEQLQQVNAQVKGVILNKLNPRDEVGYYGSDYYGYYNRDASVPKRGFLRFGRR